MLDNTQKLTSNVVNGGLRSCEQRYEQYTVNDLFRVVFIIMHSQCKAYMVLVRNDGGSGCSGRPLSQKPQAISNSASSQQRGMILN